LIGFGEELKGRWPRLKTLNYDAIATTYDERYNLAYKPEGIAAKLRSLIKEVRAEKILEVACGTGHWPDLVQDLAVVIGMDISSGMLQRAAARKGGYFLVKGDVAAIPFAEKSFDLICGVNVLHHFPDPEGLARKP
jgi:ubiquinone/menaquinone biosynthesis C-methylase UbiE